jgi:hypothetical protein
MVFYTSPSANVGVSLVKMRSCSGFSHELRPRDAFRKTSKRFCSNFKFVQNVCEPIPVLINIMARWSEGPFVCYLNTLLELTCKIATHIRPWSTRNMTLAPSCKIHISRRDQEIRSFSKLNYCPKNRNWSEREHQTQQQTFISLQPSPTVKARCGFTHWHNRIPPCMRVTVHAHSCSRKSEASLSCWFDLKRLDPTLRSSVILIFFLSVDRGCKRECDRNARR